MIFLYMSSGCPMNFTIKVTVLLNNSLWAGLFERTDLKGYAVAKKIFGDEPSDAELYEFIRTNYHELKFTQAHDFKLMIKRKNYKRRQRDVKHELEKAKEGIAKTSYAQEVLRLELEKNKKTKKTMSKLEKLAQEDERFKQKQEKRKQKHRGR